jgi:hypothetical protein
MEHDPFSQWRSEVVDREDAARKALGVDSEAGIVAIQKAYRKLAKKYHPDKNPDNEDSYKKFVNIANAYRILVKGVDMPLDSDIEPDPVEPDEVEYFEWWKDRWGP